MKTFLATFNLPLRLTPIDAARKFIDTYFENENALIAKSIKPIKEPGEMGITFRISGKDSVYEARAVLDLSSKPMGNWNYYRHS